jgi:hypothetical protein
VFDRTKEECKGEVIIDGMQMIDICSKTIKSGVAILTKADDDSIVEGCLLDNIDPYIRIQENVGKLSIEEKNRLSVKRVKVNNILLAMGFNKNRRFRGQGFMMKLEYGGAGLK